jgi:hypothetical protein
MAKIDLDSLSIEELAGLRENAADKKPRSQKNRTPKQRNQPRHDSIGGRHKAI